VQTWYESQRVQSARDRIPDGVKGQVRRAVRAYGSVTSSQRPLPDYLIIGTKRGGTTSLQRYLQQHPRVGGLFPAFQTMKGVYYFDENYHRGERWYRSHFPSAQMRRLSEVARSKERIVVGESSPYYLYHPLAAERAAATVPQAKIIVLLRDPVERAWSHWKASRRRGDEDLPFADALAAEAARLEGEEDRIRMTPGYHSVAHRHLSYVAQGRYVHSMSRWLKCFPRDQVLVLASEEFYRDPQAVVDRASEFLGLVPQTLLNQRPWGHHADDPDRPPWLPDLAKTFADDNRDLEELLGVQFEWVKASTT
jgi:hypothetical protein